MYKSTHNNHDYLKRVASHSTKPARNGRVDVLPANASVPTFVELQERYERHKIVYRDAMNAYVSARDALSKDPEYQRYMEFFHKNKDKQYIGMPSKFGKRLDEIKRLKDQLGAAAARMEDYKMAFFEARDIRYERAWLNIAKLMLPHDVVRQIDDVVHDQLRASQRR